MKFAQKLLLPLAIVSTLSACATSEHPNDPYEAYNRKVYAFNDTVDKVAIEPVSKAYKFVTPQPVRMAVGNFFDNLQDARSMVFNVLRAEPKKALHDLMRFSINSTFGLAGLIDLATPMRLDNNKTKLGDVFASYGWQHSNYFVLPLVGPSTVRDGLAFGVSLATPGIEEQTFKIAQDRYGLNALNLINVRAKIGDYHETIDNASLDAYAYTRDIFLKVRASQLGQKMEPSDSINPLDIDSLTSGDASAPK